jgi:hypothetical protein
MTKCAFCEEPITSPIGTVEIFSRLQQTGHLEYPLHRHDPRPQQLQLSLAHPGCAPAGGFRMVFSAFLSRQVGLRTGWTEHLACLPWWRESIIPDLEIAYMQIARLVALQN